MLNDEQHKSGQRSRRECDQNDFAELAHRALVTGKAIGMPRIVGGVMSDRECGETHAVNNNQPEHERQQSFG